MPVDLQEQIDEVEREIILRRRLYPKWVADGSLKPEKAEAQLAAMEAVRETLKGMPFIQRELDSLIKGTERLARLIDELKQTL